MVRTKRILSTIRSKSCFPGCKTTCNDGRRIFSARVRHGLPLATPPQLRNGSCASLYDCNRSVLDVCHALTGKQKHCQQLSKRHQKNKHRSCVANTASSLQLRSSTGFSGQVSAGGAILTQSVKPCWHGHQKQTNQTNRKRVPLSAISSVSFKRMKTTSPHSTQKETKTQVQSCSRRC